MRTEEKKQSKGIGQYIRRRAFRLDLISFAAAAGLSRVCFRDGVSPFGVAYLAAVAISGGNAHLVFVGVLLGTLLLQRPMHFAAAAGSALFYIAHLLWKRFSHGGAKIDQLILLFLSLAAMLPVFYAESVQALLKGLVGLGISVFSAFAMQSAMVTIRTIGNRHVLSDAEQVSISLFFGILLLAMSEVNYVGFSLPVVLLLVFSMIAALARGIGGVAVAVAIGAVLTVGGDFTLMFVGSLAACTLAGAALRKANTFGVFAGFLVACLVVGSYVFTASHTINLLNLAVAGVIFLVIPRSVMLSICGYLDAGKTVRDTPESPCADCGSGRRTRCSRLRRCAERSRSCLRRKRRKQNRQTRACSGSRRRRPAYAQTVPCRKYAGRIMQAHPQVL